MDRDAFGRVTKETPTKPDGHIEDEISVMSTYDLWGGRIRVQSTLGADSRQTYTSAGLNDTLTASLGEQSWESRIGYDDSGREIERFATGGLCIKRKYNMEGLVAGIYSYVGNEMKGYRSYSWRTGNRLMIMNNHMMKADLMYDYDSMGNLIESVHDMAEHIFRTPDIMGNIYKDKKAQGRTYGKDGRLLKDENHFYRYDAEGNLILKTKRNILSPPQIIQPKDWIERLFMKGKPDKKDLEVHLNWQEGDTAYEWYGNGMLKSVKTPQGDMVSFEYDALGRRILKQTYDTCHRYAWDGNVILHEWNYPRREKPKKRHDVNGRIIYEGKESYMNLTTWVYDGTSFSPIAKLTDEDTYSIVQDYLGTPIQAFDSKGKVVWDCVLDIYGKVYKLHGDTGFIPFRYQGQYEDKETGLYYNRFRYYNPDTGLYISKDPIGLLGNNPNIYAYVHDSNSWVDVFGLMELFRSMSRAELFDIQKNGWDGLTNMNSKWFAESYDDALKFGHTLGHGSDSKFYVVGFDIDDTIIADAYKVKGLDGIGDSIAIDVDKLNSKPTPITIVKAHRVKCR